MQGEARVDEGEFGFSPIERNAPDSLLSILSILSILDSLDSLVPTHQASGERTHARTHALTHPELFRLVRHAPSASRITSPRPTKLSTQRGPHRGPHDQGHIALIETKTKTKSEGPASTNEPHPFFSPGAAFHLEHRHTRNIYDNTKTTVGTNEQGMMNEPTDAIQSQKKKKARPSKNKHFFVFLKKRGWEASSFQFTHRVRFGCSMPEHSPRPLRPLYVRPPPPSSRETPYWCWCACA